MSYLTRHFQMRGAIVGAMSDHAVREMMHKKLHRADVPRKAIVAYSRALAGSVNVRNNMGAVLASSLKWQQYGGRAKPAPIIVDVSVFQVDKPGALYASFDRKTFVKIGGAYRPKRCNQHTKPIIVTSLDRAKGVVHYTQGDATKSMTLQEWATNVSQVQP